MEVGDKGEFLLCARQTLSLFSSVDTSDFTSADGLWNVPMWNHNLASVIGLALLKSNVHVLAYVSGVFQVTKEGFCAQQWVCFSSLGPSYLLLSSTSPFQTALHLHSWKR